MAGSFLNDNILRGEFADQQAVRQHHERTVLDFLRAVLRRKKLVLGIVAATLSATFVFVNVITPLYTADTMILLEPRKTQYIKFDEVLSGLTADSQAVRSEINIIRSRAIAEGVVSQLDLTKDPEFSPTANQEKPGQLSLAFQDFWAWLWASVHTGAIQKTGAGRSDEAESVKAVVINRLLSKLTVENDNRSLNIDIGFTSVDPVKAATIANAFAQQYLKNQIEGKAEATRHANDWLSSRLAEARVQVRTSDEAIQQFREKNRFVGQGDTVLDLQQLNDLNAQLVAVASARINAEARLHGAEAQLRANNSDAIAEVLASPVIQNLRQSETALQREQGELETRFGEKHPKVITLRAQKRELQDRIRAETSRIVSSLESDVKSAAAREAELRTRITEIENRASLADRAQGRLRELNQEAEASRMLFRSLAERYEQTQALLNASTPDARVVSPAEAPYQPSSPDKPRNMALALFASLLLSCGWVLVLERMDDGFRTADELEDATHLPCFGFVPCLESEQTGKRRTFNAKTVFAESIRTIRTTMRVANGDIPQQVIVVTSSVPEEGKSVFATALARTLAEAGYRTLLIDCDLRCPRIRELMGDPNAPELSALLREGSDYANTLPVASDGNLQVVTANAEAENAQDLLSTPEMKRLIEAAKSHYDYVVLDSPPILIVSDAALLSTIADAVLYVVRWGHTPKKTVLSGIRRVQAGPNRIAGLVLSRVDLYKHAKYGFHDHGHYLSLYQTRYAESQDRPDRRQ